MGMNALRISGQREFDKSHPLALNENLPTCELVEEANVDGREGVVSASIYLQIFALTSMFALDWWVGVVCLLGFLSLLQYYNCVGMLVLPVPVRTEVPMFYIEYWVFVFCFLFWKKLFKRWGLLLFSSFVWKTE